MKPILYFLFLLPFTVFAQTDSLLIIKNQQLLLVSIEEFMNSEEYKIIIIDNSNQIDTTVKSVLNYDSKKTHCLHSLFCSEERKKKKQH